MDLSKNKALRDAAQRQQQRRYGRECKICRKTFPSRRLYISHRKNECHSSSLAGRVAKEQVVVGKRQTNLPIPVDVEEDGKRRSPVTPSSSSTQVVKNPRNRQPDLLFPNEELPNVEICSVLNECLREKGEMENVMDEEDVSSPPFLLLAQLLECTVCEEFFFCQDDLDMHRKMYHEELCKNTILVKSLSDELDFDSHSEAEEEEEESRTLEEQETPLEGATWTLDQGAVQTAAQVLILHPLNDDNVLNADTRDVAIISPNLNESESTVMAPSSPPMSATSLCVVKEKVASPEILRFSSETDENSTTTTMEKEESKKQSKKKKQFKIVQPSEYYVRRAAAVNCKPYNLDICPYCKKQFGHTTSMEKHISRFHEEATSGLSSSRKGSGISESTEKLPGKSVRLGPPCKVKRKVDGTVKVKKVEIKSNVGVVNGNVSKTKKRVRSKKRRLKEKQCSKCCGWFVDGIPYESHLMTHLGLPRKRPKKIIRSKSNGSQLPCSPLEDVDSLSPINPSPPPVIRKHNRRIYECTQCDFSTVCIRSFYNHRNEHKSTASEFRLKVRRSYSIPPPPSSSSSSSMKSVENLILKKNEKATSSPSSDFDLGPELLPNHSNYQSGNQKIRGLKYSVNMKQPWGRRGNRVSKWQHQDLTTKKMRKDKEGLPWEYCAICSVKLMSPSEVANHFETVHNNTMVTQINTSYDLMMELRTIKLCKKMVQITRAKERIRYRRRTNRRKNFVPADPPPVNQNCPRLIVKTRGSRVASCFLVDPEGTSQNKEGQVNFFTGIPNSDESEKMIADNRHRFKCEFCDKTFQSNGIYLVHLLHHRGVTVCKCNPCGKLYLHSSQYNQHLMTAHNQRDYPEGKETSTSKEKEKSVEEDDEDQNQNQTTMAQTNDNIINDISNISNNNNNNNNNNKRLLSPSQSKIVQSPLQCRSSVENMDSGNPDNENNNNHHHHSDILTVETDNCPISQFIGGSKSKMLNRRQCPFCKLSYQSELALHDHVKAFHENAKVSLIS